MPSVRTQPIPKANSKQLIGSAEAELPAAELIDLAATDDAAPDHDEIARLAYEYWQADGRPENSAAENWFLAEQVLRRRSRDDQS